MTSCLFKIIISYSLLIISCNTKHNITIFAISNLDAIAGKSIVGAQWLAIQEINNNSNLLPNYTFHLQVYDAHSDTQLALIHALDVINHDNSANNTYFPIILGTPWSSLSTLTAAILGAFNMGQITAGSTSFALSDISRYPYFYRTIPSDALQTEGLILLCNTFNWTSIAVIYINDAYGLHLALGIQQVSKTYDIDVTAIAISYEDDSTYNYAAEQIKNLKIYIIILIIHNDDSIYRLFEEFRNDGITGYPYFYLGVDAWLDSSAINRWNLTEITQGFIGTIPWQTDSFDINQYTEDIQDTVKEAMNKSQHLTDLWQYYYYNGYSDNLYVEMPGTTMIYGYDAIYTLIYAIQQIENDGDDDIIDLINNNNMNVIDTLNTIITKRIDFIGTSGHIVFDKIGDRRNGLYSFGNILKNGNIEYFGYFTQDIDGIISFQLNDENIIWPKYFTEKSMIPRSDILIHEEIKTIPKSVSISIFVLSCCSITVSFICIVFILLYRENKIIIAASWRLNIVMAIGAIFAYIACIIYGIDEQLLQNKVNMQYILDILCNLRIWILIISYSLVFMPLFAKTYRLSRIFSTILTKKVIKDKSLFILIAICIFIDIVLLTIFTSIHPLKRVYLAGNIKEIDELQRMQYLYGSCTFDEEYTHSSFKWYFYGFLLFWKICEALWGIYVALNVSRVEGGITNQLSKFDETGIQLFSIMFTFVIICIVIPIFVFISTQYPLIYYLLISITILLIGNVVLSLNLFPRIFAVFIGNEEKFEKSPAEQMEYKIKKQLHRLGVEENWWEKQVSSISMSKKKQFTVTKLPSTNTSRNNPLIIQTYHTDDDDIEITETTRIKPAEITQLHIE